MMHDRGLNKLCEECGELIQIACKTAVAKGREIHPDGLPVDSRLEDEIGDVLAAIDFVAIKLNLDVRKIGDRKDTKLEVFMSWDAEEEEDDF